MGSSVRSGSAGAVDAEDGLDGPPQHVRSVATTPAHSRRDRLRVVGDRVPARALRLGSAALFAVFGVVLIVTSL